MRYNGSNNQSSYRRIEYFDRRYMVWVPIRKTEVAERERARDIFTKYDCASGLFPLL